MARRGLARQGTRSGLEWRGWARLAGDWNGKDDYTIAETASAPGAVHRGSPPGADEAGEGRIAMIRTTLTAVAVSLTGSVLAGWNLAALLVRPWAEIKLF